MTAIVEYGVGNLFSLQSSLNAINLPSKITGDASEILEAKRVILPGVGAFGDAIKKLEQTGLATVIRKLAQKGTPLLGICLGMQLLFKSSEEFGAHSGLGILDGDIASLKNDLKIIKFDGKVPHMGWNKLKFEKESPILKYIKQDDYVYYVHSFYAKNCEKCRVASSDYGVQVAGIVQKRNVFGTQFHPEKSGENGLAILRAFGEV